MTFPVGRPRHLPRGNEKAGQYTIKKPTMMHIIIGFFIQVFMGYRLMNDPGTFNITVRSIQPNVADTAFNGFKCFIVFAVGRRRELIVTQLRTSLCAASPLTLIGRDIPAAISVILISLSI